MDSFDDFAGFKKHEEEPPAVEVCSAPSSNFIGAVIPVEDEFHNNQSGVIYIKTFGGGVLKIPAEGGDLIRTIKTKVKEKIENNGISDNELKLLFAGLTLEDDRSLSDYKIQKGTTIHLLLGNENPGQMILESYSAMKEGQFELNVYYQDVTFKLNLQEAQTVKELKALIANTIVCSVTQIVLLYGGKILLDEEKGLIDSGILNHSNIIVAPALDGGDCLKFNQIIMDTKIKDLADLKASLDFLKLKQAIENFVVKAKAKIANIKQQKPELKNVSEEGLVSIMLWTSNVLYSDLNKDLRGSGDFSRWNIYLKNLLNGLNAMPYFRGTVYRGFKNYQDLKTYQKGELVYWTTVSALSKNKDTAKGFSNAKGTLFEVEVFSSRDISSVSAFPTEDEVIMPPHSCFEVIDVIQKPGEPVHVKLREIPTPRAPKVLFWADDIPEGNHSITKEIEKKGISCVFCVSTKDALRVIKKYRWLLYFANADFKIVSDMVRKEDGKWNYTAGVDLVEKLMTDYKYNFEVLIFCGDRVKAQENCNARKLQGRFSITNDPGKVREFLDF